MNITIFNKEYRVRRFEEQRIVKGYVTTPHYDFTASLHLHPASPETISSLPEGERAILRLEGHGTDVLRASNQDAGTKGDLIRYHDNWYECVSAVEYDHTPLSHWNYQFVIVPNDIAGTIDTCYKEEDKNESS